MPLFHPNFENTGDAHHDTHLSDHDGVQDVPVDRQFELVVEHDDSEGVAEKHEHVVVHFQLLANEQRHKLRRLDAGRAHDFVGVLEQFEAQLLQDDRAPAHFADRAEQLEPVSDQVEPVFPPFD